MQQRICFFLCFYILYAVALFHCKINEFFSFFSKTKQEKTNKCLQMMVRREGPLFSPSHSIQIIHCTTTTTDILHAVFISYKKKCFTLYDKLILCKLCNNQTNYLHSDENSVMKYFIFVINI